MFLTLGLRRYHTARKLKWIKDDNKIIIAKYKYTNRRDRFIFIAS
jgi:hypothetical protein